MQTSIDYESVLNPSQLEAVKTVEGPVLVIAGAGSGKTRTLVYRLAYLVESGVPPEAILLLTFTRKAAGEMMERAAGLADDRCKQASGGTFHSLAHRILRSYAGVLGFDTNFTILDRSDMEEILQALVQEIEIEKKGVRFPKRATLASILSKMTNTQITISELMKDEYSQFLEYIPEIEKIEKLYKDYKKGNQLMDYDDLLIFFRQLLSENEEIREELGRRYSYIMVDEYQDTNGIQADIIKWLGLGRGNVMVVGDDSQSIYSFRGANYQNMFSFPDMFEHTKVIKLEENYRSTQPILTLTNTLMDQARDRYTKCLFTKRKDGNNPRLIDVKTGPEQASFICRTVREYQNDGMPLKEMAILFRSAFHSFDVELELSRQGIQFVKYGGFKFMESAHIKDLLAHLRIIVNKNDSVSWGRTLRLLPNIGQKKSQAITNWIRGQDFNSWEVDKCPSGKNNEGLKALAVVLKELSKDAISPKNAVEIANKYYDPILKERFDDFPRRQKDLKQLVLMAGRYNKLRQFLDDLALDPPASKADIDSDQANDFLTLSTVHSAKGLEWSVVFIIWLMEGYFPSSKAYASIDSIEEERRMIYVAATRAKDELFLCYPGMETLPVWQLADVGYRTGLSSFIQALPGDILDGIFPGSYLKKSGYKNPFSRPAPSNIRKKKIQPVSKSGLRQGDRVTHPAFGKGVIAKFKENEKVEVIFSNYGRKLLHMKYTTLEKI
ncbi:MAG: ATP-dependent helicase [Deltaproteobacteria bacterium]|nr:ATP-dependent helicase [Deltaproteobacteria bacterium]